MLPTLIIAGLSQKVSITILLLGLLVFFGHMLAAVFRRTHIPDVLVLLLLGIVLGPHGLNFVHADDLGEVGPVFSTIALVVILFEGGMHLPLKELWSSFTLTKLLTFTTALGTVALAAWIFLPVLQLYDPSSGILSALALGFILCNISPAVVLPIIRALKFSPAPTTVILIESALSDVISVLGTIALVQAFETKNLSAAPIALQVSQSFFLALLIGSFAGVGWRMILGLIRRVPNTLFAEFAYIFVIFGICELLGLSGPIAALAAGVAIRNLNSSTLRSVPLLKKLPIEEISPLQKNAFEEIVFLVKILFFVYLGINLVPNDMPAIMPVLVFTVLVTALRMITVRSFLTRRTLRHEAITTAMMAPKGIAAAVLATAPLEAGMPGGEMIQRIAYASVLVTIIASSSLVPIVSLPIFRPLMNRLYHGFPEHHREE